MQGDPAEALIIVTEDEANRRPDEAKLCRVSRNKRDQLNFLHGL